MRPLVALVLLCLSCNQTLKPIGALPPHNRQAISAAPIPAHVTWLVDKSGSMLTNITTDAPCPSTIGGCGPGNLCPSGCPTRIGLLKDSIAATGLDAGVVNLAFFPKDTVCTPTSDTELLVSDGTFDDAVAAIQSLMPGGGTPTAESLRFIAQHLGAGPDAGTPPVGNDLVLLVTDGVPNCNANNPNTCSGSQCNCTTSQCTFTNGLCSLGCLDLEPLNVANFMFQNNIDLMILPIGFNGTPESDQMLADNIFGQMKSAIQRTCTTNADCATGSNCSANGFCSGSQWKFSSLAEYAPAADRIRQEVVTRGRCYWSLAKAETADRIEVDLDGSALSADQWELRSPTVLHFKAAACTDLVNNPTFTPGVTEL